MTLWVVEVLSEEAQEVVLGVDSGVGCCHVYSQPFDGLLHRLHVHLTPLGWRGLRRTAQAEQATRVESDSGLRHELIGTLLEREERVRLRVGTLTIVWEPPSGLPGDVVCGERLAFTVDRLDLISEYAGIRDQIGASITALKPRPVGHINHEGIQHHALPLLGTIGEVWLLRADGSLWRADSDGGLELEPLPRELHTMALVAGAREYPWLEALLPERPRNASPCPACRGTGFIAQNTVPCHPCGALGWSRQGSS